MHDSIRKELIKFSNMYSEELQGEIAELGALDINGSPREYLPQLTGFDIVEGKGIDVKIKPGIIPRAHTKKYDVVISSSSFTYCPEPKVYKKQILDLLKVGGVLWMSICAPSCKKNHNTSDNEYKFTDCFRMTKKELKRFLKPEIEAIECYYTKEGHNKKVQDIIYMGRKK